MNKQITKETWDKLINTYPEALLDFYEWFDKYLNFNFGEYSKVFQNKGLDYNEMPQLGIWLEYLCYKVSTNPEQIQFYIEDLSKFDLEVDIKAYCVLFNEINP